MTQPVFPVCCFGKLPASREFVSQDATVSAVERLEKWFEDGVHAADRIIGEKWAIGFDDRRPVRFFYQPQGGHHTLVGTIYPSFDAVGRRYPFTIAAVAENWHFDGEAVMLLPGVFGSFLGYLVQQVENWVGPNVDLKAALARVQQMKIAMDPTTLDAWSRNYLTAQPGGIFWKRALGTPDDPRRFLAMHNLAECLRGPGPAYPVLTMPPARDPGDVGFWATVTWLLSRRKWLPELILWDAPDASTPDHLTFVYGTLQPEHFLVLLCGHPPDQVPGDSEIVCDVVARRGGDASHLDAARQRYGDMLGDSHLTPSDWLQKLSVRNLV